MKKIQKGIVYIKYYSYICSSETINNINYGKNNYRMGENL